MTGLALGLMLGNMQGVGGGIAPWYLSDDFKISGNAPTAFFDFANQRYAINSAEKTFGNIFTVTRAHTGANVATYHNSSGYIQMATANTARFDYDPTTLLPRGLLIEQVSGNTVRYSEDLSQGAWTKTGCAAALDVAVVNPYGTTGAYKITEDGATSEHGININANAGGTSQSWASAFVKVVGGTRNVIISAWNSTSGHFYSAIFNPTTGAFVSGTGHTNYTAVQYPNGWWRFMVKGAAPSVKSDFVYVRMASGSTASYAGDSTSALYVWGVAREDKEIPSSYIPNNSGTVTATRQADVVTNSAANTATFASWFNGTEGVNAIAFEPWLVGNTANRAGVSFDDTTANEQIKMYFGDNASDSLAVDIIDGGANQFDSDIFSYTTGGKQYISASYKLNDCVSAGNESLGTLDTTATLPTVTQMRVGSSQAGEPLNGWVRAIAYQNVRATDLETLRLASEMYYAE